MSICAKTRRRADRIVDKSLWRANLPLDAFLYFRKYTVHVGTSGRGGKLLPPAANAALNASPGVKARRARHDFTQTTLAIDYRTSMFGLKSLSETPPVLIFCVNEECAGTTDRNSPRWSLGK